MFAGLARRSTRAVLAVGAWCGAAVSVVHAAPLAVTFNEEIASHEWTLAQVDPALPSDWTPYDFLVVEFRATSSQRFELGLKTATDHISKRIHPYPNVWVRASIPLRFYREGLGDANDLAATVNQPRDAYWINIEGGGHGGTNDMRGMSVVMRYPAGAPRLEIRSVSLAKTDPGDVVLEGKPLLDEFGQYAHVDWPTKAKSEADLRRAWQVETDALAHGAFPDRCAFGGFATTKARATGFFRVEHIDGRWWFVCPDGHLFYSTGVNGVGVNSVTRVAGREDLFATRPPMLALPGAGGGGGRNWNPGSMASFYGANILRRHGPDWQTAWATHTARRFEAWGLNTTYGGGLNQILGRQPPNKAYVQGVRFQVGARIMGMPDVYSETFEAQIDAQAAEQLAPNRDDPYLLGTFIGNEPPWPSRESQFVDLVLASDSTPAMRAHFQTELARGDTPERRRDLVLTAFARYLGAINRALKKHDPNHLNLGIRFGGAPPDYVVALAKDFDVYSLNKYRWEPPAEMVREVYDIVQKPLLLGEFHFGVAGRGMAPGLVMTMNQEERGHAYRYYVEHAAAHPEVIGTHWFQWIDQPATGRPDGENYNIGWVDVTDQPYEEFINAAKATHARVLDLHLGKIKPTERKPVASQVGTPAEGHQFGRPGIQ